ncbi:MAG: hypothetical protein J6S67_02095 [Methanobrevibacter sp.]|nr:hypothetical protein [Methanobrevibacter sp.]
MRKKAIEMTETWNKDLEVGATLEGVYVKVEHLNTQFGESEKYIIEKDDGTKIGVFSTASLTRQFNNVPVGSYVWITYKGEETSKNGRPVKVYDVDYDDDYKK